MAIEYHELDVTGVEFTALLNAVKALGTIATKDFWQGTQIEYDNLSEYNDNTLYFIQEELSS